MTISKTVEDTSDDPEYFFAYNESWQQVAIYRAADTDPKEQFVNHNAGLGGYGGSSAIDGVILRDKDTNTAWGTESDGTLEDRIYYCQNWRGDVSSVVTDTGTMVEWVKYTAYGIPFGIPLGDTDSNGILNVLDYIAIVQHSGGYDVRYDIDLSGVIDGTDATLAGAAFTITLGFGALSDVGNRKGYAGYEHAPELANSMWHVRNRVMISELLGRWITRDPIGYAGGSNLYQYVRSNPMARIDSYGLLGGGGFQGGGGRRPKMDPIYPPCGGPAPTQGVVVGGGSGGCSGGGCGGGTGGGNSGYGSGGGAMASDGNAGFNGMSYQQTAQGNSGDDLCGCEQIQDSNMRLACILGCLAGDPPDDRNPQRFITCAGRCREWYRGDPNGFDMCLRTCRIAKDTTGKCTARLGLCQAECKQRKDDCYGRTDNLQMAGGGVATAAAGGAVALSVCTAGVGVLALAVYAAALYGAGLYSDAQCDRDFESCKRNCGCQMSICIGEYRPGSRCRWKAPRKGKDPGPPLF